jgi:hypothetical protein
MVDMPACSDKDQGEENAVIADALTKAMLVLTTVEIAVRLKAKHLQLW